MNDIKKHLTLSHLFAVILCLSGGFIELYSVKTRGIYAAMQTGNLINLFMDIIDGKYALALTYLAVITVFILGCLFAEALRQILTRQNKIKYEPVALSIMTLCAIVSACLPVNSESLRQGNMPTAYDLIADCFIALLGAFQLSSFQDMDGHFYASTMMTNILRNITKYTVLSIRDKKLDDLWTAFDYTSLLLSFILGAVVFYLCYRFIPSDNKDLLLQLLPLGLMLSFVILFFISLKSFKQEDNRKARA